MLIALNKPFNVLCQFANGAGRRMTAAVGHPTLRLIRVTIGRWSLDGLQPGEWEARRQNN